MHSSPRAEAAQPSAEVIARGKVLVVARRLCKLPDEQGIDAGLCRKLSEQEIADVATYIRSALGNAAPAVGGSRGRQAGRR